MEDVKTVVLTIAAIVTIIKNALDIIDRHNDKKKNSNDEKK